ncbi:MAG: ribosome small subunit-dependent GTPase A [Acidobacteria bacterium]|nr:MAG: ribosome small subunit-dependent GTPase A [Acidobacteriota bacterium]
MELIDGTVIARHGSLIRVQVENRPLLVTARRNLTWEGGTPEAPKIVVGDRVSVERGTSDGVIVAVRERSSCLMRKAIASPQPQILAANIDQALLIFATKNPEPKVGLLDRFLVASHLAGITPVITFNKIDQGEGRTKAWTKLYSGLGYTVLQVSARSSWGLGQVKRLLPNRTTLFCGPSGAGKSSLLNAVYPGFKLRVGGLSEATGKGKHTTTRAELMPLPFGGFVVDTPGLKEFGIWEITSEALQHAFPEISENLGNCHFSNCSHVHEPKCGVKDAIETGLIDRGRYRSYCQLLEEIG